MIRFPYSLLSVIKVDWKHRGVGKKHLSGTVKGIKDMKRPNILLLLALLTALQGVNCGEDKAGTSQARAPVEVAAVFPTDGSTGVPVSALIKVCFSGKIDKEAAAAISIGLFPQAKAGEAVPVKKTLLKDRMTLVLNPLVDLNPASPYDVKVLGGVDVLNGSGNRLVRFQTSAVYQSDTLVDFDPLDPKRLTPYPSNMLCKQDPWTATGLRLNVPRNLLLFNIRPEELEKGDGFSCYSRILLPLTGPFSPASLPADPSGTMDPTGPVFLIDVDPASEGYGERLPLLVEEDPFGNAMVPKQHALIIFPVQALRPATTYALVVTRRFTDPDQGPVGPSSAFARVLQGDTDPSLQKAREVLNPVLAYLRSPACELPLLDKDLAMVLPFTTRSKQNLAGDLLAIKDYLDTSTREEPPEVIITPPTHQASKEAARYQNIDRIVAGTVASPDFRGRDGFFDTDLIHERPWDAPRVPLEFILTIPKGTSEENPADLLIFLHGINSVKEQMLPVTDALAGEGMAAIGIDIVEHGTRKTFPDLVSWVPFLHIEDFAKGRDNMRQTQADLLNLTRAVQLSLVEALGERILETEQLVFAGNSLGGILVPGYLALEPSVKGAVFIVTGGGFTEVALRFEALQPGAPFFYPVVLLAQLLADDYPFETLYGLADLAQEILDPADPSSYAAYVNGSMLDPSCTPKDVLLLEVMGDETIANRSTENLARLFCAEQVRPVRGDVPGVQPRDGPLSGNGPNGRTAGLCQFDWVTIGGEVVRADHGSLLRADEGYRVMNYFLRTCLDQGLGVIQSPYPEEAIH